MKVLINKNFSWSIDSKLKKVLEFFGDIVKLDFTVERTRFKDIPESSYSYIHAITGEMKYFNSISESWYDNNISIPAKNRGFDMVVLAIDSSDWTSNIAEGFGTPKDCGIQEIVMRAKRSGSYNYEGVRLSGDNFVWILIHEILHRLYDELKLTDNTHKYFLEGKPDKCLEDLLSTKVKPIVNSLSTATLTRLNDNGIQTTGVLDLYHNGKNMICYTLELPWKNNSRNISCIPKGTYKCSLYNSIKFGKVYKVLNVENRTGILIHSGNYNKDTSGCILVGNELKDINKDGQKDVTNSKLTLSKMLLFFGGKDFTLTIK